MTDAQATALIAAVLLTKHAPPTSGQALKAALRMVATAQALISKAAAAAEARQIVRDHRRRRPTL